MASPDFLSYNEELEISDHLFARKVVLDFMVDNGIEDISKLSKEDQKAVQKGNEAAGRLVEAYSPFAWSCARSVYSPKGNSGASVEDLYQEAKLAMLEAARAYDARGASRFQSEGRRGRRFSSYARLHVLKKINAYQAKTGFHLSAGAKRIGDTIKFQAVYDSLESSLGRPPSDKEVFEYSGISIDETTGIKPSTFKPIEIDRPFSEDSGAISFEIPTPSRPLDEIVSDSMDAQVDSLLLLNTLTAVLPEDIAELLVLFLGVDRGFPRETEEVAKALGLSKNATTRLFNKATTMVRHPQIRSSLRDKIFDEASDLMTEVPGVNYG